MKKQKLFRKVALAGVSLLACATCLGVTAMPDANNAVADATDVALTYTLTQGSRNSGATGYVGDVWAEKVSFTNAKNQTLKGIQLKSNEVYTHTTGGATYGALDGYYMHYQQHLTLKIDDKVDMSKPIEFLFNPYVSANGGHESHRFVMGLTDTDGTVESNNGSKTNGFNAPAGSNYIYWDLGRSTKWSVSDQISQALGPVWQTVASNENWTGDKVSSNNLSSLKNSYRLGGGALGAGLHGATIKATGAEILIKAKIEFTQTGLLILYLQETTMDDINSKFCTNEHNFSSDSATDCTTCWFKQTYKLADLGFTYGETELNMFFGYYNVYGNTSNQSFTQLPMSLKLYNYKNGDVKEFGVKDGKEVNNIKASESLNLADVMNVVYYDGATATEEVAYTSSNESIAKIVDGKVVPTAGTFGGEVTITATLGKKSVSFTVNVDADTVTVNGNVVSAGGEYTLENLYEGNFVLVGYKSGNKLYAVGDTITYTGDIVLEEVTVDFTMLYGASIRLDNTASIRFTAILKTADLTALETLVGADKVSYGMTLKVESSGRTYEINSKNANFQTAVYENDYTLYSAVMTGIPSTDYETELTAQAYIKVQYEDGDVVSINSALAEEENGDVKASNVRSLADVAKAAYEDRSDVQENEYQYEDGEGKYSPYTQAQLTEIAKYLPAEV